MSEFTLQKSVRDAIQAQADAGGGVAAAGPLVERIVRFTVVDPAVDQTTALFTAAAGEKVLTLAAKVLAKPTTWGDNDIGVGGLDFGDAVYTRGYGTLYQDILPAAGGLVVPVGPVYTTFPVYAGGETVQARYFAGPQNEIQLVALSGTGSGTYTLTFDGQTTAPIAFDASAAVVQAALEALSNIGAGNVSVTAGGGQVGYRFVEFTGVFARTDVPLMTLDNSLLDPPIGYISQGQVAYDINPTGPALDVSLRFLIWSPAWT